MSDLQDGYQYTVYIGAILMLLNALAGLSLGWIAYQVGLSMRSTYGK